MFIDARSLEDGRVFQSDVCIIGAGAAGIALATPLTHAGLRVDLIESGGFESELDTQSLTLAKVDGFPGLMNTMRLRYFGGTTNHWGGWCHPLEPFDFEEHAWIPGSGWPISLEDLAPYYVSAKKLIGIDSPDFRFNPSERQAAGDLPLLGTHCEEMEPVIWRVTQPTPTKMGAGVYRDGVDLAPNLRCFLRANATELIPHSSGRRLEHVKVATLTGRKLRFEARRYVLCCGAIENARLLLLSDSVIRGGVGNQHDLVGRYFCDHGTQRGVQLVIPAQEHLRIFQEERFLMPRQDEKKPRLWTGMLQGLPAPTKRPDGVGFRTTNAYREQQRTLGFAMIAGMTHKFRRVLKSALAVDALGTPPQMAGNYPMRSLSFVVVPEQSPNPDSRVMLDEEKDALGLRMTKLEVRSQEIDLRSRSEGRKAFALAVARAGSGRVRLEPLDDAPWLAGFGGHQTGTTRMANDPKRGVTDRNGKVHGVENLFVMGSSLYPTAGWQHPTLTIFALTLRLADHLKSLG